MERLYLDEISNLAVLIANLIRKYRPKILFTHYFEDKHPDHKAIGESTKDALFLARTKRDDFENEPYNCTNVLMFISDITKIPLMNKYIAADVLEGENKALEVFYPLTLVKGEGYYVL